MEQVGEDAVLEDEGDRAEGGDDGEQVAEARLDRHGDRAEDDRQQHEREPDDEQSEGQQRGAEALGDVDADGGEARDGELDAILVEEVLAQVADVVHELLGGLRVRPADGDDLDDARVGGCVGRRERDGRDAGQGAQLVGEVVHEAERIGGLDDRAGDDERAVEALAEVLGDEVVGHARGVRLRQRAGVGQGEAQLRRGEGERAEAGDDEDDRDHGEAGDGADPTAEEARAPLRAEAISRLRRGASAGRRLGGR